MPDLLDTLSTPELRMLCMQRGIAYPGGSALSAACKHELVEALRSPQYVEAYRLGLIGS